MTSTTQKKPRPARRRKPKPTQVVKARSIKDLSLFEIGLLPFLYLEQGIKLLLTRFSL